MEPFQRRLGAVMAAAPGQDLGGVCGENSDLRASCGPMSGSAVPALSLDLVLRGLHPCSLAFRQSPLATP